MLFYCFQVLNKYEINSINFELKAHFEKTYMIWLSLIKSRKWLNQNFSNLSQNRIGFKFRFWTHFSILIMTFCSSIIFQWNLFLWKANTKWNKYVKNMFFLIRTFTMPTLPLNKRPQIWTNLESFSYLDWIFSLLLGLRD